MPNYPVLPRDKGNNPLQQYPSPIVAKARYTSENATASSVISFTHDTEAIEVVTVGAPAAIRWIATSDTQASIITVAGSTANYDHFVPSNSLRRFAIPIESHSNIGSVQGLNRLDGLYQRIAIKTVGVASVMLTEY